MLNCSARYEGENEFIGFNFPSTIISNQEPLFYFLLKNNDISYVIGYKKDDESTLLHELRHARFYMDQSYKNKVIKYWYQLPFDKRLLIKTSLLEKGYQDHVMIDEFQAYYPDLI